MPCDGKNANCDRRRELLAQLKCLVSSMDRKKPCEWDEPPCPPPQCVPISFKEDNSPCRSPVQACKSFEIRSSLMWKCECTRRNGLQDRCMMMDCMGRPECMTQLYPVCGPGRSALLKLTDLGDAEVALKKFYSADKSREAALAAYCRLKCGSACPLPPPCSPEPYPPPPYCNPGPPPPYCPKPCPPPPCCNPCPPSPRNSCPPPPPRNPYPPPPCCNPCPPPPCCQKPPQAPYCSPPCPPPCPPPQAPSFSSCPMPFPPPPCPVF